MYKAKDYIEDTNLLIQHFEDNINELYEIEHSRQADQFLELFKAISRLLVNKNMPHGMVKLTKTPNHSHVSVNVAGNVVAQIQLSELKSFCNRDNYDFMEVVK